jgi:hypothetical protein
MTTMIKVYIASPYRHGDTAENVRRQMETYDKLVSVGFAPFAPLWSHFQQVMYPLPVEMWYKLDLVWVEACDCLLRLEGESKGADEEVRYAKKIHRPVLYTIDELITYYNNPKNFKR